MRKIINTIVLYYFFIFRRKEFERRIEESCKMIVSSFFDAINEIPFFSPALTK